MDMNALLPLLMRRNGGGDERMQTLLKLAGGEKPDIGTVMDLAKQQHAAPLGLTPITSLASYTIIGKLAAHFASPRR